MSTAALNELRKEAKKYLDHADERMVKLVFAMLEADARNEQASFYLSPEQDALLNEQIALYEKGDMKFSSWDEARERIAAKMKK